MSFVSRNCRTFLAPHRGERKWKTGIGCFVLSRSAAPGFRGFLTVLDRTEMSDPSVRLCGDLISDTCCSDRHRTTTAYDSRPKLNSRQKFARSLTLDVFSFIGRASFRKTLSRRPLNGNNTRRIHLRGL